MDRSELKGIRGETGFDELQIKTININELYSKRVAREVIKS